MRRAWWIALLLAGCNVSGQQMEACGKMCGVGRVASASMTECRCAGVVAPDGGVR